MYTLLIIIQKKMCIIILFYNRLNQIIIGIQNHKN